MLESTKASEISVLQSMGIPIICDGTWKPIESNEDFLRVLEASKATPDASVLVSELRRCYKSYLKHNDILHLLSMGPYGLTDTEIAEACSSLPVDADGGMLLEDLMRYITPGSDANVILE